MSTIKTVEGCSYPNCKNFPEEIHERCSGCKKARYCSEAHQRAHWPYHKQFCVKGIVNTQPGVLPICNFARGTSSRCEEDGISWYLPFCRKHCKNEKEGCALQGCAIPARLNSDYCSVHACGELDCSHRFTCCPEHGSAMRMLEPPDDEPLSCALRSCHERCLEDSMYCALHYCPFDFQPRQLCGHICALEDCEGHLRKENDIFCQKHTCKSDTCQGPWPECGHKCQYHYDGPGKYPGEVKSCYNFTLDKFCVDHGCSKCNRNVSIDKCDHCCKHPGCPTNKNSLMIDGICISHRCSALPCREVIKDFGGIDMVLRGTFCEAHTCSFYRKVSLIKGKEGPDFCTQKVDENGHCQRHKHYMTGSGHRKAGSCECDMCTGPLFKSAYKD